MKEKLISFAETGNLYAKTGCVHFPVLIEELKGRSDILTISIYCENLREVIPTQEARFEQAKQLATWIPPVCRTPEKYTAAQVMEIVLRVLPQARKQHHLSMNPP